MATAPGKVEDAERNSWAFFVTNYSIPWPGYDNYSWSWEDSTKRWKGTLEGPTTRWTDAQLRVFSTVYAWGYGESETDTRTNQNKKKNVTKTIETETAIVPFDLYGKPVPWSGGLRKIKGEVLWSSNMTTTRKTVGASSDGGTLSAETTTEKARISFAVIFGEGLSDGTARTLRRVWANDTLIFDQASKLNTELPDIAMRWYSGTDTQLSDRLIRETAGDAYAVGFRRMMYLVFEEFPADKFDNSVPEIFAEIEDHSARPNVEIPYIGLDNDRAKETWTGAAIDWEQDKLYVYWINPDAGDDYDKGMISVYSISQEIELFRYSLENCNQNLRPYVFDIIPHLNLGIQQHGNSNGVELVTFDLSTGEEKGRFGTAGTDGTNSSTNIGIRHEIYPFRLGDKTFMVCSGASESFHVFAITDNGELIYITHHNVATYDDWVKNFVAIGEANGECLVLFSAGKYIYSFTITRGGFVVVNDTATLVDPEGDLGTELCGGIIVEGPASRLTPEPVWPASQWPIFLIEYSGGGGGVRAYRPRNIVSGIFTDWEVSARFPLVTGIQNKYFNNSYTKTGPLFTGIDNTDDAHTLNVQTLEVRTFTTAETLSSQMFYHATSHSVVGRVGEGSATAGDNGVGRIFFERAPYNTETLETFLTEICKRAGYSESEIEIIGLNIPIYGWIVSEVSSLRDLLEPLGRAFDFAFYDGPEKITIIRHTKDDTFTASYTIPLANMAVSGDEDDNSALSSVRDADREITRILDLTYFDKDNGYEPTTVRAQRSKDATASDNVETVKTRIVMKATLAKQAAFRALQTAWTTRIQHSFRLPQKYYRMTAGIGIEVQVSDTESFYAKVDRIRKNADFTVDVTVSEMVPDAEFYGNNFGGTGNGSHLPGSLLSDWHIVTLRPIKDAHDTASTGLLMYFACAGIGTSDWPGANIYISFDNKTYLQIGRISNEAITGKLISISSDQRNFTVNRKGRVEVVWLTGNFTSIPTSISYADFIDGANTLLIGRSQKHWENIYFKKRRLYPGSRNRWYLEHLARGMANTDGEIGNNDRGDTVIYYTEASVIRFILPNAQLGKTIYMKAVHYGYDITDIRPVRFVIDGHAERPVSVARKRTVRGTGNRIELRWDRRTRFSGGWQDGTGTVPLNEDFEGYLVEIFDAEGDIIRSEIVDTPEYNYLDADQTADGFTGAESTLKVRIRQLSAMLGAGEGDIEDVRVY